MRLCR